ncbi:hypothetical protein ACKAV7_012018 [Fusarium commune]
MKSPVTLALPLLPTEQIGPKIWVRNIFFFELQEGYNLDVLAHMLKVAYGNLKKNIPIFGCEVIPAKGRAGLLKLQHYGNSVNDFSIKDLRAEVSLPSFDEIKAQGYPSSMLDPEVFCTRGLGGEWPQPEDHMTTTLMQANFVRGGLLLNISFLHVCFDQTTVFQFLEVLSEEVRLSQGVSVTKRTEVQFQDRQKFMRASRTKKELDSDHPEYTKLESAPIGVPPKLTMNIHHGEVWYFSPERLSALKDEASPKNAMLFKKESLPPYVSTNDALTALVWRSTMAAQHPTLTKLTPDLSGLISPLTSGKSQVAIAIDLRRRTQVSAHKNTIGNIIGFAPAILDLYQVIHEASLADLAIMVRRATDKAKDVYLDELITIIDELEDMSCLVPTCLLDTPGNHMVMTSWRDFPFYDLEWGPAFGNNIRALRAPSCGLTHGVQVILPDPKKGGSEVWVGVEDSSMERLANDPIWKRYAELPSYFSTSI